MYKRILVAVDGSETAALALRQAIELARASGARLRLVHVVDEMAGGVAPGRTPDDFWRAAREGGERILRDARALAAKAGAEPETKLVEIRTLGALFRRVSAVIAAESDRWRADLVVLGTHGRRGVSKLVLGSVADGVVRTCGSPVLLVRPTARRGRARRSISGSSS
jgi:nucleotide-binding universal stress UspA family protein